MTTQLSQETARATLIKVLQESSWAILGFEGSDPKRNPLLVIRGFLSRWRLDVDVYPTKGTWNGSPEPGCLVVLRKRSKHWFCAILQLAHFLNQESIIEAQLGLISRGTLTAEPWKTLAFVSPGSAENHTAVQVGDQEVCFQFDFFNMTSLRSLYRQVSSASRRQIQEEEETDEAVHTDSQA